MENKEKIFVDGMMFKAPREGAPVWIKGSVWIKVDELKAWLDKHNTNSGGINIDLKEAKNGNLYFELNTWKPEKPNLDEPTGDIDLSIVPF